MKKFLARVFVGLLTFTFGVTISSRRFVRPHVNRSAKLFGPPCREGLVSVEPQLDVPLRITISYAVFCLKKKRSRRHHATGIEHIIREGKIEGTKLKLRTTLTA